jgi:hypothetical protein
VERPEGHDTSDVVMMTLVLLPVAVPHVEAARQRSPKRLVKRGVAAPFPLALVECVWGCGKS